MPDPICSHCRRPAADCDGCYDPAWDAGTVDDVLCPICGVVPVPPGELCPDCEEQCLKP